MTDTVKLSPLHESRLEKFFLKLQSIAHYAKMDRKFE